MKTDVQKVYSSLVQYHRHNAKIPPQIEPLYCIWTARQECDVGHNCPLYPQAYRKACYAPMSPRQHQYPPVEENKTADSTSTHRPPQDIFHTTPHTLQTATGQRHRTNDTPHRTSATKLTGPGRPTRGGHRRDPGAHDATEHPKVTGTIRHHAQALLLRRGTAPQQTTADATAPRRRRA